MHLLDTDTVSRLHAGHSKVAERLRRLEDPDLAITVITRIELLRGRFDFLLKASDGADLLKAQEWLDRTEALLSELVVVPMDAAAATQFDRLRQSSGLRKLGRADLLIASIALGHSAVLVTRNLRDFRQVPGLAVDNWID